MFPPVELMDTPLATNMPPSFRLSESDHKVMGPAFVWKDTLAEVIMLLFDFRTIAFPSPVTVMFAPAVRSLDAPVAVRVTGPEALMAPVGDTTPPVMLTPPPLAVRVPAPEYVPETETEIEVPADTFLAKGAEPPEDETWTDPDVEEIVALEADVVVMSPDPESKTSLDACSAPVGEIVVPPDIVMPPEEAVKPPAPANVVLG
jgi:hypothetical protein